MTPSASVATPPSAGIGFDLPDLSSLDLLADMADNCLAQDLARQEAEALAAFEVEKHQNGKYAILALKDKSEMTVVVPDSVEAIGPGAFEGSDVMTVTLPEGLLKIGDRAFANCIDLDSINFPRTLRVIGNEAFAGCANLDMEAPEGVRIGEDAFPDTDPDTGSSDRVQFLLDKISGMMAEAEALFDDDEDYDDEDYDVVPIEDDLDVVLIDDSRDDDVRVEFLGFTDVNDEVHMWFGVNSHEDKYTTLIAGQPKINGKECKRGWILCDKEVFAEDQIEINLTDLVGIRPKGKYEISAWLQCSIAPQGLFCGSEFLATVDFDKGIQSCYVVDSSCDRLEKE